jgi:hypothetical protein
MDWTMLQAILAMQFILKYLIHFILYSAHSDYAHGYDDHQGYGTTDIERAWRWLQLRLGI